MISLEEKYLNELEKSCLEAWDKSEYDKETYQVQLYKVCAVEFDYTSEKLYSKITTLVSLPLTYCFPCDMYDFAEKFCQKNQELAKDIFLFQKDGYETKQLAESGVNKIKFWGFDKYFVYDLFAEVERKTNAINSKINLLKIEPIDCIEIVNHKQHKIHQAHYYKNQRSLIYNERGSKNIIKVSKEINSVKDFEETYWWTRINEILKYYIVKGMLGEMKQLTYIYYVMIKEQKEKKIPNELKDLVCFVYENSELIDNDPSIGCDLDYQFEKMFKNFIENKKDRVTKKFGRKIKNIIKSIEERES